MSDEQREAAWEQHSKATWDRGVPPCHPDFMAGWDAAMAARAGANRAEHAAYNRQLQLLAAKAEPVPVDREVVARIVKRVTLAWGGPSLQEFADDPPLRKHYAIADAVIAHLAAQPQLTFSERECQNGPESDIAAQQVTGTAAPRHLGPEPAARRCSFDFHGECAPCVLPGGHQGIHRCLHEPAVG